MSSREEIVQLINNYCFLIDQGNLEGFAALFEHGEWGQDGGTRLFGKEQMLEMLSNVIIYPDGTPRTRHVVTNIDLQIDDERGSATCKSYITLLQQTDDLPLQVIFSGQYNDTFERVDGGWRFTSRITSQPLFGDLSAHFRTFSSSQ